MNTDRDEPRRTIRSHAVALIAETKKIRDDIDAGLMHEARERAAQVEGAVYKLGDLLSEQIERRPTPAG
jgi:hypothetical protein